MLRVYAILAVLIGAVLTGAGVYLKGYKAGSLAESARWQAEALKDAQEAAREREALQQQLREREAKWVRQQEEASNAVAQVRVEYLPGRTIVKREIVERAVFRDCRIGDGMRDTINSALAGRPVPGAADIGTDTGRLPADA